MRFNPRASIDESQIETRSGGGGGGGGMIPLPTGNGGRVGLGTIVLVVVFVVIQQFVGGGGGSSSDSGQQASSCRTGADANASETCAVDLFTNSVQKYWSQALPEQKSRDYQPIRTVRFDRATSSGCGQASESMGPFYCPQDKLVYLDTRFFDDMLTGQLGAKGGTFSIGYVIAHEYGHHIEDQLGILGAMKSRQGASSDSVRVELMADCLAGAWAKNAQQTEDAQGQPIISDLTRDDVRRAIDAAQAVGDDRIQQRSQGHVDTDTFTHGTSAQRERWFETGLQRGTIDACDTRHVGRL